MIKIFNLLIIFFLSTASFAADTPDTINPQKKIVYKISLADEVSHASWRIIKKGFEKAEKLHADIIIIHIDTYGGLVIYADSIRSTILNSHQPVYAFIDKNAASAGALISIACDQIFMTEGSAMGAATVVNQTGEVVPDKYQSYMRGIMRATAESHGKDTLINGNDTILKWKRDPTIAEAMVDPKIKVEGVIDSGKVITFTSHEAIKHNYCDGIANNIDEILQQTNITHYEIEAYAPSTLDNLIGFLLNPALQGIFIMLIIGGIYYELQSPGIGFPLAIACTSAILYFSPLYLEGLAENWELSLFLVGLILLALELFVIPGFGVAGILGVLSIITAMTLSLIDNFVFSFSFNYINIVLKSLLFVSSFIFISIVVSIYFSKKFINAPQLKIALNKTQEINEGYIGVEIGPQKLIGRTGMTYTDLSPSGKVIIDNVIYDSLSEYGFLEEGTRISVTKYETGQIYVVKV